MAIYTAPESLHLGTGTETVFGFNWPYLVPTDIGVTLNGIAVTAVLASTNQVVINPAPASGVLIRIFRSTPAQDPTYLFASGIPMLPKYIDGNNKQLLYALQEGLLEYAQTKATAELALSTARSAVTTANSAVATSNVALGNSRRSFRVPDNEPDPNPVPSIALRKNKLIGFDSFGNLIPLAPESGSALDLSLLLASADGARSVGHGYRSVYDCLDDMINVMSEGARGTGLDFDDSPAFARAFAKAALLGKPVFIPACPAYYNIGDLTAPYGITVFGVAFRPYTAFEVSSVTGIGGALVKAPGASYMIKWQDRTTLQGVVGHGRDRATDFIDSNVRLGGIRALHCGMYRWKIGFGSTRYMGGEMINSNISGCTTGVSSLVDSKIFGGYVNANEGTGIYCPTGSNDNNFNGVKNEWNNGDNYNFYQSNNNVLTGSVIDRAGLHNIRVASNCTVLIQGNVIRRGGRISGQNLYLESTSATVIGNIMYVGPNDDGLGAITPATGVRIQGTNRTILLQGNDLATAGTTTPLSIAPGTTFTGELIIKDNAGVKDVIHRPGDDTGQLTVAVGATSSLDFKLRTIGQYERAMFKASIALRTATGQSLVGDLIFWLSREGGNAGVGGFLVAGVSASAGLTLGVAAESFVLSITNVAADGATATFNIKNNHTQAISTSVIRIREQT
jgi:hypothetical protein